MLAYNSAMNRHLIILAALLSALYAGPALSADACFTASKTYQIHALHGGQDKKDGWTVQGDGFAQCVHRAEAADKALLTRYPDAIYNLSLAATAGCHAPCN
jgi:hypothetical protein